MFEIIALLITLLCLWALFKSIREKNIVGLGFSVIAAAVFGFFAFMSLKDMLI